MTGAVRERGSTPGAEGFARARADAEREREDLRVRAARTVASHALTRGERDGLLAMLDLPNPSDETAEAVRVDEVLIRALRDYVHAVARAIGVPADGVTCEVTDTVTAYLPLASRAIAYPDHDLMLVWSDRRGWSVLLETRPAAAVIVIGSLDRAVVVRPAEVERFITDILLHPTPGHPITTRAGLPDRANLVERLRLHTR